MRHAAKHILSSVLTVTLLASLAVLAAPANAAIPDGKVAVIRATAIDGIANYEGRVKVHRNTSMSFDGSNYVFADGTIPNLEETKAILVVDQRQDVFEKDILVRRHSQDVMAFDDSMFEVQVTEDTAVTYQVASIAGNLRLIGDEGHILCTGGTNGPYQIWRIDKIHLVDTHAITAN